MASNLTFWQKQIDSVLGVYSALVLPIIFSHLKLNPASKNTRSKRFKIIHTEFVPAGQGLGCDDINHHLFI